MMIMTLPFQENPIQLPSGSCLSMRMLERVLSVDMDIHRKTSTVCIY